MWVKIGIYKFRPGMRKALADAVEAFLNLLDQIDADADLEEDNPPEDDAPCEDVGDNEPSLGALGGTALGGYFNQAGWAQGASDDREDEHDGCEPGGDDEPTLGATTAINQGHAWRANADAWGSCDEAEPSLGWGGVGCGHPEMALRGYDDDRERTTGPRDEEDDDSDKGELDGDWIDSWFNPLHLPGGNGTVRRPGR
ncbi:helix-turn-helix domain-containing protein [Methylocystis suflitae]|uniref:hypothetical protein n=1 Tax=Methylocystis suflitae TaxID=2951405 RepID=UPI00210C99BD|nr:hypothetical protein [Methylocystis suflitae]MCQ4191066.1 hypothetical protein [Methylocystis suflitae]